MNRLTKVEKEFTLAVYDYGRHKVSGMVEDSDIEFKRLTFAESLVPIKEMISEFQDYPLGTKIKVTMSIIPKKGA